MLLCPCCPTSGCSGEGPRKELRKGLEKGRGHPVQLGSKSRPVRPKAEMRLLSIASEQREGKEKLNEKHISPEEEDEEA